MIAARRQFLASTATFTALPTLPACASLLRHAARARRGRSRIDMLMAMGAIAAAAISVGE